MLTQDIYRARGYKKHKGEQEKSTDLGHGAPDLDALHVGNVPCAGEVEPVGFVQLGADEEVEVGDERVLAHQGGRQAQLAVRLGDADHLHHHFITVYYLFQVVFFILGQLAVRLGDADHLHHHFITVYYLFQVVFLF